jgi:anti-sigma B factor antagonist
MPGARDHHAGQFIGVCSAGRAGRVMGSDARHVAVLEVGTRLPGSGLDRREDPASSRPGYSAGVVFTAADRRLLALCLRPGDSGHDNAPGKVIIIGAAPWYHIDQDQNTRTVTVRGELDMSNAGELASLLTDLPDPTGHTVVRVDLAAVTFIDSTAISALIAGYRAAHDAHLRYAVVGVQGQVEKVLRVAGVLEALTNDTEEHRAGPDS